MVELSRISLQHNPLKILQSKKLQTILLENKLLVVLKTLNKSQSFQQRAVLRNLLKMIFLLMMVMKNSSMIKQIRNKMVSKKIIKRWSKMMMEIKIQRAKTKVKMMMDKRISHQMMMEMEQVRTSDDNRPE